MKGLLLLSLLVPAVLCQKLFVGDQVLRINAESEEQIGLLRALEDQEDLELDFWLSPISSDLPVDVRVPFASLPAVKVLLESNNIPHYVMIKDVQELLDQEKSEMEASKGKERGSGGFNFGAYHTLDEIYTWMDTLVAEHRGLVSKVTVGNSYEKRPLYSLKFSTGGTRRPAIWIDAGIHSREWVSSASAVWMANQIAADYGRDPSVTSLLDAMDVYVMIVNNPDGYVYTHTSNRMWRKTRSANPGSSCRGVDPNRNFNAGFGGPGASTNPCSEIYQGPRAESEAEVRSVVDFIKNHGNFKSFISIHAYSQLLMYPHGYSCGDVANAAELDSVAKSAAEALSSVYGTSYRVGSICNIIYPASGGSIDWSYDSGIKYSFAFELRDTGRYGFLLPASQIIPTATETWQALRHIVEYVRDHPY
ncbi:carboxypeptidase A2-like [Arapaima gigas]